MYDDRPGGAHLLLVTQICESLLVMIVQLIEYRVFTKQVLEQRRRGLEAVDGHD